VKQTYIALLRGINVGGHKLPMKELARMFEDAGCDEVRTYIQSGNALFTADAALARRMPRLIAAAIRQQFDFDSPVIVRSEKELGEVVAANPFAGPDVEERELHVAFLAGQPSAAAVAKLDPDRSPPDEFAVHGREIYMRCPNGMARTKLTNAWFDRRLDTVSTMRNWRTTRKLLELAGG
jgi:uncharacterized protein (DUF1697 family)